MRRRLSSTFMLAAACSWPAIATEPRVFRACTTNGVLFDLNSLTGVAEAPRTTGLGHVVDVESNAAGQLFMLTSLAGSAPNSFYRVDADSGVATLIGDTGLSAIYEGDLAFNPTNGYFYGVQSVPQGSRRFFRVDPTNGAAIELAHLGNSGDFSGLTYAADKLFTIDTLGDRLYELNANTGTILSSVALSIAIDSSVCGMDYDPATGVLFVAGLAGGVDGLFTLDPATGEMALFGETGVPGIAGLCIVPEPASAISLVLLAGLAMHRHCRSVRRG